MNLTTHFKLNNNNIQTRIITTLSIRMHVKYSIGITETFS